MKSTTVLAVGTAIFCLLTTILCFGEKQTVKTTPEPTEISVEAEIAESFDASVTLRVLCGQTVREMPLDEYLSGVLFAEMPERFASEALKAQAVASRTFALRQAHAGKHTNADICTDAACCQGWLDPSEAPSVFAEAVAQTDGLVVTYQNELIDATYFSSSGGRTEAAVAVWGGDVPYLQSVDSPDTDAADSTVLSAADFAAVFRAAYSDAELSGAPETWFGAAYYTAGGGIDRIRIGGVEVRGTALRSLLGLRSTDIRISVADDCITFATNGYGHRVGMSQYGADAMAKNGSDFEEILCHYYRNTEIKQLSRQ